MQQAQGLTEKRNHESWHEVGNSGEPVGTVGGWNPGGSINFSKLLTTYLGIRKRWGNPGV